MGKKYFAERINCIHKGQSMSEVTESVQALSWRVEAEKTRGRGKMDRRKMGEEKDHAVFFWT